jgi:Flp pilus assembly protein TadD
MIRTLLAFLLLALGAASSTTVPTTFAQLSRQADQAHSAGQLPQAIRLYRQAVQMQPNWSEGWWSLASIYYEQERFPEAQAALNRYIALGKASQSAYAVLGLCEYETREYDRARQHLDYWVRKGSAGNAQLGAVASFRWAELLTREGRFLEAVYLLDRIAASRGSDPTLVEPMGLAWMRIKSVPEDYPPEQSELVWLAGTAAVWMAAEKFDLAHEYLDRLALHYDQTPGVHFLRGFVYETERKGTEARQEYRQELKISPHHAVVMAKLAVLDLAAGELDEARAVASQAVVLEPQNAQAHYALGRVLLADQKPSDAVRELEAAGKLAPNGDKVHLYLAEAYRKIGQAEKAARETATFRALQKQDNGTASPAKTERPGTDAEGRAQ